MDGASTGLLQPPCSIAGHSWGDISALRSSFLAGYICLWVFPGGLLVALQLQFLCREDFHRLACPFPWYPDAAPPQGLCAAEASSAHQSHWAGSAVCEGEGEVLQPSLAAPGCTRRNRPTGKFSWLGMGLDAAGKLFFFFCSAFFLIAQAHKPLLLLCLPCNNLRSMHKALAYILAGLTSLVSKRCPWLVLLGGLKLRLQPWESTTSPAQKEPLGEQG